MAYYTGVAYRVPVLKTAPQAIIDVCDTLFTELEAEIALTQLASFRGEGYKTTDLLSRLNDRFDLRAGDIGDFYGSLIGHNVYFSAWYQNIKEEIDDVILYETRASTSRPSKDFILLFLNELLPALSLKEGDIVCRFIGEEGYQEDIIYLKDGVLVLSTDEGWEYNDGDSDDDHPANHKTMQSFDYIFEGDKNSRSEIFFTPPWNVFELKAQLDVAKQQRSETRSQEWWR